jgi:hypothetical protein
VAATICVMLWAATGQDQLLADYEARANTSAFVIWIERGQRARAQSA